MQKHTEIVDTTPTHAPEQRASTATAVGAAAPPATPSGQRLAGRAPAGSSRPCTWYSG